MTHIALQRVIVRMMFDPELVKAVYSDAAAALAEVALPSAMLDWLTRLDSRSYGADAQFRGRALYALAGEYPVSTAIAVRTSAQLNDFFSSRWLHESVQAGTSLALAYGDWLVSGATQFDARVCEVAPIERAMVTLRRPPRLPQTPGLWLGTDFRLVDTVALAMMSALKTQLDALGHQVTEAVLDTRVELTIPTTAAPEPARLLLEGKPDSQITVEVLNEAMGDLLGMASGGCSEAALLSCARRHGADPGEDVEIVSELISDGLLRRVEADEPV